MAAMSATANTGHPVNETGLSPGVVGDGITSGDRVASCGGVFNGLSDVGIEVRFRNQSRR